MNSPIQPYVFYEHNDAYHCNYPQLLYTSNDQKRFMHTQMLELFILTINIPSLDHNGP